MIFEDLINKYQTFIFDFDGVISDTNELKKNNVLSAVSRHLSPQESTDFVDYFVKNNGVPREIKFKKKFGSGEIYNEVLSQYDFINKQSLSEAKLVHGVSAFLNKLHQKKKQLIILSGGKKSEIDAILFRQQLTGYFDFILSGPLEKKKNLASIRDQITGPVIYFGDSQEDYYLSDKNNLDFVFVSSKTQFLDWEKVIGHDTSIEFIYDFCDIE